MKILLCCGAGASTSLVAESMRKSLPNEERDNYIIKAETYDRFSDIYKDYDVILLGPQIRYKKKALQEQAAEDNIPVDVIDPTDYALQNGEKILNFAKELYNNSKK